MLDLENLPAWDAQDALLTALRTQLDPLGVASDLGSPTQLQRNHVWIAGGFEGTAEYEETGGEPSEVTFTLTINVLTSFAAEEFSESRAWFIQVITAVQAALSDAGFTAEVDQALMPEFSVGEGRDGEGRRQLGGSFPVECRSWS